MTKKLILASSSPYRQKLLERLGLPFMAIAPNVKEQDYKDRISDPKHLALTLAKAKAHSVFSSLSESAVVIGADQVAHSEGQVLGKPITKENAIQQLLTLRGKTHELISGICIYDGRQSVEWAHIDRLSIKDLTKKQIQCYVEKDNPLDCTGSCRIEGAGIALFEKIETDDYTAIIGLPLMELSKKLVTFGLIPFTQPQ